MNRFILLMTTVALGATSAAVAQPLQLAQQMSVDQMINSLRPTASTIQSMQLRGVRPPTISTNPQAAAPRNSPTTSAPTATSSQAQTKDASSINLNVQFQTNSAQLTPDAKQVLDNLARALSSATLAPYHFQIVGHTDAPGDAELNKVLSQRRAQTVVDYMVTKHDIARERLDAWGVGSDDPLVPTPRSEVRNRRVQIVNVGT
jgi:outer membrane protein OmpA-like peptidoglycan-associated protein